jgi:aspartate/methionine/tyrosine aminotransferase
MTESRRIGRVQAPIIPTIADLIRRTPGTISLGQGVVSYGPPPESLSQIERFYTQPELHKYQPVFGLPELCERLKSKLSSENGIIVEDGSRIVVTAGGNMAFVNALLAIADPDDEIILQLPYYFNHEMAITMANCRPILVPTDSTFQLQPDVIEKAITPRTRAVVTISPNNPTGAVYSEQSLRAVNDLCRERGIYHISDEAYEYFTFDPGRHFSPGSIESASAHTISLFSFSKAFGMASWRVGYMVIPEDLFEAVNKIQDTILICPPVISQFAAIGALDAGKEYCTQKLVEMTQTRLLVRNALDEITDRCEVPPADGAFYFFLRLASGLPSMKLAERLVSDYHVAAIPGSAFGLEEGCQLRVSYGALDSRTVAEGIGRLIDGIRSLVAG